MSQNQQQSRRGEKKQYRRPARPGGANSAQPQKLYKRVVSSIKDGGGDSSSSASTTTNLSFKKPNGQGGKSSAKPETTASTKSESTAAQNYAPSQSSVSGASNVPMSEATIKPTDMFSSKNCATPPEAQSSELASGNLESASSTTTIRDDTKREVSLQFGSFSPGLVNGMKIPARTSSAPPNLDEQKRKQANLGSFKPETTVRTSSISSRPQPRDYVKQSKNGIPPQTQSKRDMHAHLPAASVITDTMSSSLPFGMSMTIPLQQSHIPVQFGIPSPQIQAQGMTSTSLQMPMPLPVGSPGQVQQPAFVPGFHPHPLQPQGLMHQGQGFNFFPPIGHQLGPQFGSSGIGFSPRFAQRHIRNSSPRRAVKITHPKTHEELKLDERADKKLDGGSCGPGSHRNVGFQMHPIAYDLSHPVNYFSHVHPAPVILQTPTSVPSASSQTPSNLRFNSSGMHGIAVSSNTEFATTAPSVIPVASSASIHVTVKSDASPNGIKILPSAPSLSSAVNERSRVNRTRSPPLIVHSREESKIHHEQPVELSQSVPQPASSDKLSRTSAESFATLSSVSAGGKLSKGTTGLDTANIQLKMTGKKDLQAETSCFAESSTKASTEIDDCAGNAPGALKAVEPSISNLKVGHNTSRAAHSETEECQATAISSETCGEIPVTTEDPLPTADVAQILLEGRDDHQVGDAPSHDALSKSSIRVGMDYMIAYEGQKGENYSSNTKGKENIDSLSRKLKNDLSEQLCPVKRNEDETICLMDSSGSGVAVGSLVSSINLSGPTNDGEVVPSATGVKIASKWGSKNKPTLYRVKSATSRGKKKRKEILQKADAAGSTSDIYMAFKDSKERPESTISSESVGSTLGVSAKQISPSSNDRNKSEPDDWENGTEFSTPKLEIPNKTKVAQCELRHAEEDASGPMGKMKYPRDFLLTLSLQFTDLPSGFKIAYDLVEALMDSKASISMDVDCDLNNNSGQIADRPSGVSRPDYRGSGSVDDGRWNKSPVLFASGLEPCVEITHRGNTFGFRPGQGGNGGFRNLREPHLTLQGGIQHSGPDADRWQHATRFQKVFTPMQSPLLVMHKAAKKYEVRKVTDAEEAKQRLLKAILNKLTPQNFDRLFVQVKEVNIENAVTLFGVISQIFDKALMEPTFCEMYANFCYHLAGELPDFVEDNQKITFKRLLLNKCQEEFERHEREQAEADKEEGDGEVKQSEEEREEKRIRARRRMLGNIRLIGELYKKKMLTERIMHECIHKLLGQYQNPNEEDIEALCKLMSTIGEMIDHPKAKQHMDAYFEIMRNLSDNMNLSSRLRFMLKDVIDLRENKWQQRRKVEGPKKIEELHRDAAQERQASRMSRGHSFTSSVRKGHPADIGPRPSTMFSQPSVQMGAFRGMPSQTRGFGTQDVRLEDRLLSKNRSLPVTSSHRAIDTTITLGPQGGLARGMSVRGLPMLSGPPFMDVHAGFGEFRRMPAGMDGYNSMSEWTPYNSKQEAMSKYAQENHTRPPVLGQSHQQGPMHYANKNLNNSGHSSGRSVSTSPPTHIQRSVLSNRSFEKARSEERLSELSMVAIREFYSARDENEVVLCVKDLNAPSLYPSMISLWVTDSFERKDRDRDLLSWLLVNLTKSSREGIWNIDQLAEGFQSVLATLEDAVTDAPKAATYLGYLFGRIIIENVISMKEIGHLLQKGGEEPGHLMKNGLAYEVLESAFEMIRSEKGESTLKEICRSSNIQLEDFHPSGSRK